MQFNSSNPWRSRSQPPPPSRSRSTAAPPPAHSTPASHPPTPPEQPQDPLAQALAVLDALDARFRTLVSDFTAPHPSALDFTPKASSAAPKLSFTPTNAPVHGYEEALTRLLTELDAVDSGGVEEVRNRRKGLVKAVEGEAQRVEAWRRDCWEARERGEQGPEWVKAVTEDAQLGQAGGAAGQDGAAAGRQTEGGMGAGHESAAPAHDGAVPSASTAPRPLPGHFNPSHAVPPQRPPPSTSQRQQHDPPCGSKLPPMPTATARPAPSHPQQPQTCPHPGPQHFRARPPRRAAQEEDEEAGPPRGPWYAHGYPRDPRALADERERTARGRAGGAGGGLWGVPSAERGAPRGVWGDGQGREGQRNRFGGGGGWW